jgi:hypothetical protein
MSSDDLAYLRAAMAYADTVEATAPIAATRPPVDLEAVNRLLMQKRAERGIIPRAVATAGASIAAIVSQNAPGRAEAPQNGRSYADYSQARPAAAFRPSAAASEAIPAYTARIAPALAAYCLDYEHGRLDAPYQLYEYLRALDQAGRGDVTYELARSTLSGKESPYYRYGRRRLAEVLNRGEGLFWHRAKDDRGALRIWLHKRARVAALLGVRMTGHEVLAPLSVLIPSGGPPRHRKDGRKADTRSKHAEANAALYACFHAGRVKAAKLDPLVKAVALATDDRIPTTPAGPIARGKIRASAGISRYRQRSYEKRAHIRITPNLRLSPAQPVDQLDRPPGKSYGPVYTFIDHKGYHGPAGQTYDARRLSNSYQAPGQYRAYFSQRTRKLNQDADRLRISSSGAGITPDSHAGPQPFKKFDRVFYESQKGAEQAYLRTGKYTLWRGGNQPRGRYAVFFSHGLPAMG